MGVKTGAKAGKTTFPGWPVFDERVLEAVSSVLRSGKLNYWAGDEGTSFENEFGAWLGGGRAVAVANGTVALDCCLRACEIGPGDDVVVTPRSFIASVSPVVLAGANPVFADVDRQTQNVTVETIEQAMTPRTKAILVVHFAGLPCDMLPILELAKRRKVFVIEDCAQALGARIGDKRVGTFGDVAAFSFCQDKILSTGEGGMVVARTKRLWEKVWSFKDHGKSYQAVFERKHPPGYRWYHESFGTNARMTELQAAIARVLLPRVDDWIATRNRNAQILTDFLSGFGNIRVGKIPRDFHSAFYKFHCFVVPSRLEKGWSRERIQKTIHATGVSCLVGSCSEIYLEKAFPEAMRPARRLPVARELGETSLMFNVHPTLSSGDMLRMTEAIGKVLKEAGCQHRVITKSPSLVVS